MEHVTDSKHPTQDTTATADGTHAASRAAFAHSTSSHVMPLAVFFVAVMMISTITGTKGVQLGPLDTDGAFYLFPLAYILGDVISEKCTVSAPCAALCGWDSVPSS